MLVKKIIPVEVAFGRVLRAKRKEGGLSQEALALEAGIDRNFVSLMERGLNQPSLSTVFKLAKALKVEPASLLKEVQKICES
jgi:transcriptional regulator with XRE-family HTH domain